MRPKRSKIQRIQYVLRANPIFLIIRYCFVRAHCRPRCMVVHIYLLVMKPCSHVVCKVCTDSLVRPANQCIVCDRGLTDPDIVELKREGMYVQSVIQLQNHSLPSFLYLDIGFSFRYRVRGRWARRDNKERGGFSRIVISQLLYVSGCPTLNVLRIHTLNLGLAEVTFLRLANISARQYPRGLLFFM